MNYIMRDVPEKFVPSRKNVEAVLRRGLKHPQVYRPAVNWSVTPLGSSLQDSGQVFETVLKSLLPV